MKVFSIILFLMTGILIANEGIENKILSEIAEAKTLVEQAIESEYFIEKLSDGLEAEQYNHDLVFTRGIVDVVSNRIVKAFGVDWYEAQNSYHESINDYTPTTLGRLANNQYFIEKLSHFACPVFANQISNLDQVKQERLKASLILFEKLTNLDPRDEKNHYLIAKDFNLFRADFASFIEVIQNPRTDKVNSETYRRIKENVDPTFTQILAFVVRRIVSHEKTGLSKDHYNELMGLYRKCSETIMSKL
jgi:hypothetical protein